jgi:hypothetical protein
MRLNFYGFDPSYHVARYNFIHKIAKSRSPLTLARHRSLATSVGRKSAPELRHAPSETWPRVGGPRH